MRFLISSLADSLNPPRREQIPLDLLGWAREVLPDHFTLPPSRMHIALAETLDQLPTTGGSKTNIIAPRGGAKSTIISVAYALYAALELRIPLIWLFSDTLPQMRDHFYTLKNEIESNQDLAELYPEAIRAAKTTESQITFGTGVVIKGLSTGQKVRGRKRGAKRPALVILDDPENDGDAESPAQREKNWNWLTKALLKAGTRDTNFIVLGTALHRDCISPKLERNPGWESMKFQAIEKWPDRMDLWAQWEDIYTDVDDREHKKKARAFYETNKTAMHQGAVVLWPESESLYDLMTMRIDDGRNQFESEKQGNCLNPELCEFPEDYFGPHIWFDEYPKKLGWRLVACDPSKGKDAKRGDYQAIVWIGVRHGIIYVDADLDRVDIRTMVEKCVVRCIEWGAQDFGIETNTFQELLESEFNDVSEEIGFPLIATPIENMLKKEVRIRRLTPYLSKHRLRFKRNSKGAQLLVNQLKDFPLGDHDDGPDALEMVLRLGQMSEMEPEDVDPDGLGDYLDEAQVE